MNAQRIIKVYIADDHPIIRKGLVEIIQEQNNIECVGQGSNGKEAFEHICELEPEIAIIDIDMPVMSGLEVCEKAMRESPLTRFVILTMHKEESYYKDAMAIGVLGYLNKDTILNDLWDCINAVQRGDKYVSPNMRKYLQDGESKTISDKWAKKYELTPSEINILKFVTKGKTNKEIAEILFVSEKAIEAHRTNCIKKFGIESGKNALMKFLLENKEII